MAYDKQKVIDIALGEEGYLEKETNSSLDSKTGNAGDENYTKYARDLAAVSFFNGSKTGKAWCAVYVAWCVYKAFGKEAALKLLCQPTTDNCGAGCEYIYRYFKAKKQWHTSNPQAGDVIVFWDSKKKTRSHTGWVYKVDGSKVYTIEGNTSGASGVIDNGGGVFRKSYSLSYSRIAGYGRPDWGMEAVNTSSNASNTSSKTSTSDKVYAVKKGDSLWTISKKYLGSGTRYKEIMQLNDLKSALIRIGQKLKLPKK